MASAWTLKMLSNSSQPPPFSAKKACFIILGVQAVSLQHFYLIQVFFGRRFAVPMALYPFLHFFLGILSKLLCFQSLTGKIRPHTSYVLVFYPAFSITFHDASSSPRPRATATSSKVISFCHQNFVAALLAQVGRVRFLTLTTDANCQKLRAFSLHLLSHQNMGFRGTLIALGTKRLAAGVPVSIYQGRSPPLKFLCQIQNQG